MIEMRFGFIAALSLLATTGCGNKSDGDAAAPSAKPTVAATAKATAAPAAPALRDASGKLTKAGFDAAWKEVYVTAKNAAYDPAEKKLAAFEAKVGKPAKMDGNKRVWWVYEGADCHKAEMGPDGTKGTEKVPADKCEK